ncbi:MAG: hypothetical protein ACI92S_004587 [Planctomycetaceae bacterium]
MHRLNIRWPSSEKLSIERRDATMITREKASDIAFDFPVRISPYRVRVAIPEMTQSLPSKQKSVALFENHQTFTYA